jgi:hypothetical protein
LLFVYFSILLGLALKSALLELGLLEFGLLKLALMPPLGLKDNGKTVKKGFTMIMLFARDVILIILARTLVIMVYLSYQVLYGLGTCYLDRIRSTSYILFRGPFMPYI